MRARHSAFPKLQSASPEVILQTRIDAVRRIVDMLGVEVSKPIKGESDIARAACSLVASPPAPPHCPRGGGRCYQHGAGAPNRSRSHSGLHRRKGQLARNAEALGRTFYKNEANQIYNLSSYRHPAPTRPFVAVS